MQNLVSFQMRQVFFIRHLWNEENSPSKYLKNQGLFGIHFVDEPRSFDPKDYSGNDKGIKNAKRILEALHGMGSDDLICSSFDDEYLEVGVLDKSFAVQLRDFKISDDKVWVLKVARHDANKKKMQLHFAKYPMLLAGLPRQGTFGKWHLMREQIISIYDTGKIKRDYTALAPAQIEVLCASYLFNSKQMICLSLPAGRTLKDIDIVGQGPNGERILAQVTFSEDKSKVRQKAQALAKYKNDSKRQIFFAPNSMQNEVSSIEFIALEKVWNYWQNESGGIFLNDFFGAD